MFFYGTAWKEAETQRLTELAIGQGFLAIDTANQRRHYDEAAVGKALAAVIGRGVVVRDDIFLQTKFTFRSGQDHRMPYDPEAPVANQVAQSFASSKQHLGVATVDSLLLHGPSSSRGWQAADEQAWLAMERLHDSGQVRFLGVSNVDVSQLASLVRTARVPPTFVQNRCYASLGWDQAVREFCRSSQIAYQGFSLLTANQREISDPRIAAIASRHGRTIPQVIFRFAMQLGIIPLTGTTQAAHMRDDLQVFDIELTENEITQCERIAATR